MDNKNKTLLNFFAENKLIHTIFSIILGLLVGALFISILGISVSEAYGKLFSTIFSGPKSWSYCIVYATPYIITGLSVAFSFKTGIFNIGAEGQFVMGSIAACYVAIKAGTLPSIILVPLCFIVSMIAGGLWGVIVAILKTKKGINEVLSMIMLNWIAFYLSNFIVESSGIKSTSGAEATQNISENARIVFDKNIINSLGLCNTANYGIFIAIILTILVYIIIEKSTLGYRLKAVGYNKDASNYAGIDVDKSVIITLLISGALSGLAGAIQLMGMSRRISIFAGQEGYGFAGIVVALIGLSNPFGVLLAGLFYGALKYGGRSLNLVHAPTQVIDIVVGTIVFFISISCIFEYLKYLGKKKDKSVVKEEK